MAVNICPKPFYDRINDIDTRRVWHDTSSWVRHDVKYAERRRFVSKLALDHEIGRPVPRVHYTEDEHAVWGRVMGRLTEDDLLRRTACDPYIANIDYLGYHHRTKEIPQIADVSDAIEKRTGWRIRPVSGALRPREFLGGLAFKHFHSPLHVRHPTEHTTYPEPDVCHTLVAHAPMLADECFADFLECLGKASLFADAKELWHLTKLYYHVIKYGVIRQSETIKAFGPGVLGDPDVLAYLANGPNETTNIVSFDPFATCLKSHSQDEFFVVDTFEDAHLMMQEYGKTLVKCS